VITYLVVVTFILATSFSLSQITKLSIADYIPISIFIALIWTTIFGIFNQLLLGAILLLPTSLLIFVLLWKFKPNLQPINYLKELLSLPILVFLILTAWTFKHSQGMQFTEWDEFTHWGYIVKSMNFYDVLGPNSPTQLNSPEYPPGLAILSYLIVKIGGNWDEADVIWGYQLLFISMLIPIIKNFNYKKSISFLLSFSLLIFGSVVFYDLFKTIYSDPILSIIFGFTLFLATSKEITTNRYILINLMIVAIAMMLIKDIAIYFTMIPIFIALMNKFMHEKSTGYSARSLISRTVVRFGISLFAVLLTRYIWSIYVSNGITKGATDFSNETAKLASSGILSNPNFESIKTIFIERVLHGGSLGIAGFQLNTIEWILVIAILLVVLSFTQEERESRKREYFNSSAILLGAFGYLVVLFVVYLIVYSGANATGLTSYERYVSTYFSGVIFYLVARSTIQLSKINDETTTQNNKSLSLLNIRIPTIAVGLIVLLMFQSPSGYITAYISKPNEYSDALRSGFTNIKDKIRFAKFTQEDRVWIITQHLIGFEFYLIQYEALPASVGRIPFSLGSPSGPGDIWTEPKMTLSEWDTALDNYDYVIVYRATDSFIAEYGSLFEDPESLVEQGIYRVVHGPERNQLIKHL
jgi:hypothetical protein